MAQNTPLSMESLLDEENREVLASSQKKRTHSPVGGNLRRNKTPPAPVRSMLDVDDYPVIRHGSIAGLNVGITSPPQTTRGVRLDPSDPSTWTTAHSKPTTPATPSHPSWRSPESPSVPKIQLDGQDNYEQSYKGDSTTTPASTRGTLFSSAALQDRNDSPASVIKMGPSTSMQTTYLPDRTGASKSPTFGSAQTNLGLSSSSQLLGTKQSASDRKNRRLSEKSSSFSDDSVNLGRVEKDDLGDEEALDSSGDDAGQSSSEEESRSAERGRARTKSGETKAGTTGLDGIAEKEEVESPKSSVGKTSPTVEKRIPHSQQVLSLLGPGPAGGKRDHRGSSSINRAASPNVGAEGDDERAEINKAKSLSVRISHLDDTIPDRHVRMVIRGDWAHFNQEDAELEVRHEPRLYLACSDLSHEASYALEWTIGTLLKDGDTLLIISAVGDEHASKEKDPEQPSVEAQAESAKAAAQANTTMEQLTKETTNQEQQPINPASLQVQSTNPPKSRSRDGRHITKKEDERIKAVDKLETDFLRHVRKTTLQVRCMIEVIHCRNPRHLMLNAIDELGPTLVVVGTRGQGTVKNVMMGSFSNYLVTKSSVPVMVARKRLKKPHHAKVSSTSIRLTNNLSQVLSRGPRRSLTQARID